MKLKRKKHFPACDVIYLKIVVFKRAKLYLLHNFFHDHFFCTHIYMIFIFYLYIEIGIVEFLLKGRFDREKTKKKNIIITFIEIFKPLIYTFYSFLEFCEIFFTFELYICGRYTIWYYMIVMWSGCGKWGKYENFLLIRLHQFDCDLSIWMGEMVKRKKNYKNFSISFYVICYLHLHIDIYVQWDAFNLIENLEFCIIDIKLWVWEAIFRLML